MKTLNGFRPGELSVGQLGQRITDRIGELLESQVAMARAELATDFRERVRSLCRLAIALVAVTSGVDLLLVAVVLALATTLSGWITASILAVPFLVGGLLLLRTARAALLEIPMQETSRTLKADWRWLRSLRS